jgi:hypothetical protein
VDPTTPAPAARRTGPPEQRFDPTPPGVELTCKFRVDDEVHHVKSTTRLAGTGRPATADPHGATGGADAVSGSSQQCKSRPRRSALAAIPPSARSMWSTSSLRSSPASCRRVRPSGKTRTGSASRSKIDTNSSSLKSASQVGKILDGGEGDTLVADDLAEVVSQHFADELGRGHIDAEHPTIMDAPFTMPVFERTVAPCAVGDADCCQVLDDERTAGIDPDLFAEHPGNAGGIGLRIDRRSSSYESGPVPQAGLDC